jgi:DNA-binding transcriptional LysR family regulator
VRELNSQAQVIELAHGQLDVGFVHTMRVPQEMSRLLFATEPFVCCLPAGHRLAGARKLAVRRLQEEAFVMFSRTASPDYYERVLTICTDAGFQPDVRHEARHWLSVVALVAEGLGVALVPAALRHSAIAGAVFVPIESDARSQVFCIWRTADDKAGLQALVSAISDAAPRPRQ